MLSPKALSLRSTVWRFFNGSKEVRREESAGGISDSRREVKMSARLAVRRVGFVERIEASAVQAGAPRVLPLSFMVVTVWDSWRGVRWGRIWSAVSSFGVDVVRVNVSLSMIFIIRSYVSFSW